MISGVRREKMRATRNSQYKEVLECLQTGNLEDFKKCFLTNGKLDKLLLKTKFGPILQETALHLAVKYRREDIVKWLLSVSTADIQATDHFSCTVLHTATNKAEDVHSCAASSSDTTTDENKDNNIIELILSCEGVDVNARDMYGNTPVKLAAERGKIGAVRLLLEKAADITIADNADNTTLHVAAKKGHKEVLELLLKTLEAKNNTGIIGKQNTDKDTPLHLAATSKCPQCVALLLNAGAASTVELKNEQGLTATDLAKEQGHEKIIKVLKNPKRAGKQGLTATDLAKEQGHEKIIKVLKNPKRAGKQGLTATDLATEQGHEKIIKVLKNPKRARKDSDTSVTQPERYELLVSQLNLLTVRQQESWLPSSVEEVQDVESSCIVTSEGGSVTVNGIKLTCPPGAVDDPVPIKLKLEEPYKYCGLILQRGLENDVVFGAPIINCQPNGQMFKKRVTLTIPLDRKKGGNFRNGFLVLHGTPTTDGRIAWEDITRHSKLLFQEIEVKIARFSRVTVLWKLWIHTKEIITRLNIMPFKYALSVLFKSNRQNSPFDSLALVFMSQDIYIYQYQSHRDHCDSALVQLKNDNFKELVSYVGHENNFIYNRESLTVSIQLGEDYKPAYNKQECLEFTVDASVWWSTGHVVTLPLQGCGTDAKVLCGRIIVRGQYGHVREDHFCQNDLCGYVRQLLGVENVIFNLKPVTLKLGLPEETLNPVVACWQSEAEQLEMILLRWREKQENTDDYHSIAMLRKAFEGLEPADYKVKERGQMHIGHLRKLAVQIVHCQHKEPNTMKYFGHEIKNLCNSICRDCCIEMATSKEDLDLATSTENCASLLEVHRQIPEDVARKYKHMCLSPEESITRSFLMIVPHLVQCIKEIFRDEKIPHVQSGLRGVPDETTFNKIASGIQEAAESKNIFRLLTEVCNILERLCLNNNDNRSTEDKIHEWGCSAMVISMLEFLEKFFQGSEAQRLYKRLYVFSVSIRNIMLNPIPYQGNLLSDFHNVALSLLMFAKFDPSQLVRYVLQDSSNSSSSQGNDGMKYDKSKDTFSQLFWIRKETENELQLEAIAHVHVNGHIQSIGAFESVITLPASCSETIDKIPFGALSVVVKREHDDSRNLCVTVSATQKEKIIKALKHLENELGADLVNVNQTEITPCHLKMRSFAQAGTLVTLRLVHKWGSETLVVNSNDVVTFADSTAGGACVPDPEMAAEINRLAIKSELTAPPVASHSTVGNYSRSFVMDPSNAELIQRHLHEQRGRVEINYYQNFLSGHVCVSGEKTTLNMQFPAAEQRSLEAGPSTECHRSLTAGTDEHKV